MDCVLTMLFYIFVSFAVRKVNMHFASVVVHMIGRGITLKSQ